MHLVGDITVGNVITVISIIIGAAFTGGKLVEVLKMLAADVAEIKMGQDKAETAFRLHEKEDAKAFSDIHEKLIEIALRRTRDNESRARTSSSSIHPEAQ